jgi:hypothetical protein
MVLFGSANEEEDIFIAKPSLTQAAVVLADATNFSNNVHSQPIHTAFRTKLEGNPPRLTR